MQHVEPLVAISDPGEVGREQHNRGDRWIIAISNVFAWLFPILVIAICSQVVMRSAGFNQAWLDDMQWWLYGSAVLIGIGYAVTTDSHVRVDIFYDNYPKPKQDRISIFGLAWLFLPFIILCWDVTVHYAISSVQAWEGSDSPNGLHNLFLLKVFMNLSFIFIGFACWFAYVRCLARLTTPVLWKKLLFAFPSVMYLVNLAVFYVIWWAIYLTTPAEDSFFQTARLINRHWIFDEVEIGVEDIKITIIITLVLTVLLIGAARLLDRSSQTTKG